MFDIFKAEFRKRLQIVDKTENFGKPAGRLGGKGKKCPFPQRGGSGN